MYPVSERYKTAIRARARTDRVVGTLTLTDGTVLALGVQDFMSGSLTLDNQCVTGEELAFGCVYLGQAAFSLRTSLSRYAFYGAKLVLRYELQLPGGSWEAVPLGVYTVAEAERKALYVSIKAYDNILPLQSRWDGTAIQGNAYEMLSDFYKAHPEVLKKEIKGVKLMFIHAYPVGDCVMTKSAPILKLDDIKGKKLGFEGGGLRFETMQALGASVVGMNMSDLYQAMQGGIIDGIVMDFDPLISRRYGEEVKHVTLLNITGTAFYVVMNQERYDSLPDDLKAIVDDMSQNYGPNLLEKFWAENVYGSLDKWIKEMGGTVHVLSDEDYARADKLAAVPAQAWFKSLDKAGYRGAELEKTFHQLEAKYFTPWRQSEAYRYVKQQ